MARRTHPKKKVDNALDHAEANGWRIVEGGSHAWGKTSIWSTPKNPGNHARALRRVVDNCATHRKAPTEPDSQE
jgi:hypothetical protein